jgi:signal transduction histidine kinase
MAFWLFSKKKTDSSQRGKDDFISIASHELRSPLSIVKWYTEILLDEDAGPLTEDQKKYLSIIETSNERAIALVRSLLNVSRLDLGTFSVSPSLTSPLPLIDEAIASLTSIADLKKIVVTKNIQGSPREMMLDPKLFTLIVRSLLSNAIIFSKDSGKVEIGIREASSQGSLILEIKDEGIGIPEDDQKRVFSKMFKASNTKDAEANGSGLGLYITKSLVDYIGGSITFSSKENKGTSFVVMLPLSGMKKKEGRTTLD